MPYRILIVEDDEILLGVYSTYLEQEGMEVVTALDAEKAIEYLKTQKFDLLLTDVKLPGLSGIQLIKKCKEIQPDIPSVIVSGHATVDEAAEAVNLKVFHYLKKPIKDLSLLKNTALEAIEFFNRKIGAQQASAATEKKELSEIHQIFRRVVLDTYLKPRFGIFTAGLAHNVNSPLGGVMGYAQLASMKHPEIKGLDIVAEQALKASQMLARAADKGHLENNRKVIEVDLKSLIENEIETLDFNLFFKHNIKKQIELKKVPAIKGIAANFSQIFNQLVQNAIDAMYYSQIKELRISLSIVNNEIVLEISDTGEGIDDAIKDKIFQPGFSTKPLPSEIDDPEQPCGYGMGLYVVSELVKEYDGNIEYTSNDRGGTTVLVKFPIGTRKLIN